MIIAFDLDDVLADTISVANGWFNQRFGTNYKVSDYVSPRYNSVWGREGVAAEKVWGEYVSSPLFKGLQPLTGGREVLEDLAKHHTLHVITSRNSNLEKHTRQWVDEHFPGIFTTVTLTNHNWEHNGKQQLTKLDVCKQLGAEVIVEDNPDFISEIIAAGIPVLMRKRPWNNLPELMLNDMVYPFSDWEADFLKAFSSLQSTRDL